jgi:hypothetical protein
MARVFLFLMGLLEKSSGFVLIDLSAFVRAVAEG